MLHFSGPEVHKHPQSLHHLEDIQGGEGEDIQEDLQAQLDRVNNLIIRCTFPKIVYKDRLKSGLVELEENTLVRRTCVK